MSDPRITTARAVELLAKSTRGPWRGDRFDGTVKYAILAGDEADPVVVLTVDHKNATYGFGCCDDGFSNLSANGDGDELLTLAAPDLAADLIDARATIDALTAELKAARELRGIVVAREHARAVRAIFWRLYNDDLGCEGFWRVSATRSDLIATLTRCGLTDAEAVKAADGEVSDG